MIEAIRNQIAYEKSKSYLAKNGKFIVLPLKDCDDIEYDTDEYWKYYIFYLSDTKYHPVGTCKMSPRSDPEAVVDERLRVHGVHGLRVIDASM